MKMTLLLALFLSTAAAAQEPEDPHVGSADARQPSRQAQPQQPQGFVPYEINESDSNALLAALGDIPAKYSVPILNFLQIREQRAEMEAQATQHAAAVAAAQAADKTPRIPAMLAPPKP